MRRSVKKDGANWYVVFDLGNDPVTGKRLQKKKRGFKTKKESEKYIAEQLNALEKGTYFEPSNMSFREYLDYWLENYAKNNTAPKIYEGYHYMINTHIEPALGNVELSKLLPFHIQNYYTLKMNEGQMEQGDYPLSP